MGSVETGLSPLSRSPCPTAGRWEHWAGLVLRCRQCWGSPLGLVCLVPREMLLMWTPSEGVWGRSGLPGPPPPRLSQGLIENMDLSDSGDPWVRRWSRVVAAVGRSPWEVSGPSWLVPKFSKERARSCSETGLLYPLLGRCCCSALCQLGAPQLCSPNTEHGLALGLKEDLNWTENP